MNVREVGTFENKPVHEIALRNAAGAQAAVLTWGAVLHDLIVPLSSGPRSVVLGFPDFAPYPLHSRNFGAIVGRFANRIADARFTLDGVTHQLTANDGPHHLHGGAGAFGKRLWSLDEAGESHVVLSLLSNDGDSGYPGTLQATCTYRLLEPATLSVTLTATTNSATIVNLAHHSYFNLAGAGDITTHKLQIDAAFHTPTRSDSVPTGEIRAVRGTAIDFTSPRSIGASDLDMNYVLDRPLTSHPSTSLARAAILHAPDDTLALEIWTTEPGVQFYNGFKLDVAVPGSNGERYRARAGVALEPQRFPNSPNVAHFPNSVLRAGDVYEQHTEYRFNSGG